MPINLDHPKARALSGGAEHASKTERKYYLMQGGQYLHWSATKLTSVRADAWSAVREKGINCRRVHDAAKGCVLISVASITPTFQPVGEDA